MHPARRDAARTRPCSRRAALAVGAALLGTVALGACEGRAQPPGPPPIQPSPNGQYVGQELWIAFSSPGLDPEGRRPRRTREEARALVDRLRSQVEAGTPVGALTWEHSNAPGSYAQGFSGVLPRDRARPDVRDDALMRTPVGRLSPIVEWHDGFWFARRVDLEQGRRLQELFERLGRLRVRARVIHVHHRDAYPWKHNITRTREQAVEHARALLARLSAGEDFAALARAASEDDSGDRDGVLRTVHPDPARPTEWLTVSDPGYPWQLLKVLFVDGPVGRPWTDVVVHGRGMDLVEVLERREVEGGPAR